MDDAVTLTVDGAVWSGWTEVRIRQSIERCALEFELGLTDARWTAGAMPRPIRPGSACSVAIGADVVMRGFVDETRVSYDRGSHDLRVAGRDRTGDLIDCAAAVDGAMELKGLTLTEVAARLAKPYGVAVRSQVDVGRAFDRFALQPGETAWEAIERAARQRAVLPNADGLGGLVLTRAGVGGRAAGALVMGGEDGNVVSAEGTFSHRERFGLYVVRGQQEGDDETDATGAAGPEARVTDTAVDRWRPTVILAEQQGDGVSFQDRAAWAARVAAGRSRRCTYTVQGWRAGGALWRPNTIVPVRDAFMDIDRDLLVVTVTWTLGADGSRTELEVAPADAFALVPEPPRKRKGDKGDDGLWEVGATYVEAGGGKWTKQEAR